MVDGVEGVLVKGLGQRVRALRLEQGLTLAALGERLGTSESAVCHVERRGVDRISTLEQMAWALDAELVVELRPRKVA